MPNAETCRIALAERLAREAGEIAKRYFRRTAAEHKLDNEIVTQADRAVQAHILEAVRRELPNDGFIGEEAARAELFTEKADAEHCWVIDPIDGTNNFAAGMPLFAVSIAVLRNGAPALGLVYDPCRDELYQAERGRGAWRNGEPLRVAAADTDSNTLVGLPSVFRPSVPPYVVRWAEKHKGRMLGSIALHLAYVAAGCLHWTVGYRTKIWDVAAGTLLVEEAGGRVTDLAGSPLFPTDLAAEAGGLFPILASNGALHDARLRDICG
jgi:myo-inositol-1(or 4)-monophosphatase